MAVANKGLLWRILIFAPSLVLAAPPDALACSAPAAVFYVNGVNNTYRQAEASREALQQLVLDSTPVGCIPAQVFLAWNRSRGSVPDLFQAFTQTLADVADDDGDLLTHLTDYRSEIGAGSKVIIVAHSQGNLYANKAFDILAAEWGTAVDDHTAVVAVASPAAYVGVPGRTQPYITLSEDTVASVIFPLVVAFVLPPNTSNRPEFQCTSDASEGCHSFVSSYLQGPTSRRKIKDAIVAALPPPPICTAPTITSVSPNLAMNPGESRDLVVQISSSTSGQSLAFQWYRGASEDTSNPLPGQVTSVTNVSPVVTTSYWVRVTNACGFDDSGTITVTVNGTPPPANQPPTAHFTLSGGAELIEEGQVLKVNALGPNDTVAVTFSAVGSISYGTVIAEYRWSVDGQSRSSLSAFTEDLPIGWHSVSLSVVDGRGDESPPITATVGILPPGGALRFLGHVGDATDIVGVNGYGDIILLDGTAVQQCRLKAVGPDLSIRWWYPPLSQAPLPCDQVAQTNLRRFVNGNLFIAAGDTLVGLDVLGRPLAGWPFQIAGVRIVSFIGTSDHTLFVRGVIDSPSTTVIYSVSGAGLLRWRQDLSGGNAGLGIGLVTAFADNDVYFDYYPSPFFGDATLVGLHNEDGSEICRGAFRGGGLIRPSTMVGSIAGVLGTFDRVITLSDDTCAGRNWFVESRSVRFGIGLSRLGGALMIGVPLGTLSQPYGEYIAVTDETVPNELWRTNEIRFGVIRVVDDVAYLSGYYNREDIPEPSTGSIMVFPRLFSMDVQRGTILTTTYIGSTYIGGFPAGEGVSDNGVTYLLQRTFTPEGELGSSDLYEVVDGPIIPPPPPPAPSMDDDFNSNILDSTRWQVYLPSPGGATGVVANTNGRLEVSLSAGVGGAGVIGRCSVSGDFDVQVDYGLVSWPSQNRHGLRLIPVDLPGGTFSPQVALQRNGTSTNDLQFHTMILPDSASQIQTTQTNSQLRLVRSGSTLAGYAYDGSSWVLVGSGPASTISTRFALDLSSSFTTATAVQVFLDNFKVNSGNVSCP